MNKAFIGIVAALGFAATACTTQDHAPRKKPRTARPFATVDTVVDTIVQAQGKTCLGVVDVEVEQSSFSLNPVTHLKDHMNASKLTIAMFPDDYKKVKEGQRLSDTFRAGSLMYGSVSWREVKVKKKRGIECR